MRHVLGTVAVLAAAAGIVLAARPGVPEGPESSPSSTTPPLSYAQCVEIASEIEYGRDRHVREAATEQPLATERGSVIEQRFVVEARDYAIPSECADVIEELAPAPSAKPGAEAYACFTSATADPTCPPVSTRRPTPDN
ncbi:hypothetical protein [Streptomyces youssoufiensis]